MTSATLFSLSNSIALLLWLTIIIGHRFSPLIMWIQRLGPLLFGLLYLTIIVKTWGQMSLDSFGTIDSVRELFNSDDLLLAGWLHYLAFDLFLGCWQIQTARQHGIPFLLIIPALLLTFLFGPVGYLTFLTTQFLHSRLSDTKTH